MRVNNILRFMHSTVRIICLNTVYSCNRHGNLTVNEIYSQLNFNLENKLLEYSRVLIESIRLSRSMQYLHTKLVATNDET